MEGAGRAATSTRGGRAALLPAALALLGAFAAATPYLASAWGLEVDVPSRVEVVDHVVPGAVIVASGAALLLVRGRAAQGGFVAMAAAGLAFLAGFWITSTHVPLLFEAADAVVGWDAALFHMAAGPLSLLVALWLLVPQLRVAE